MYNLVSGLKNKDTGETYFPGDVVEVSITEDLAPTMYTSEFKKGEKILGMIDHIYESRVTVDASAVFTSDKRTVDTRHNVKIRKVDFR